MVTVKRLLLAIAAPTFTPSVPTCSVGNTCRPKIADGTGPPNTPASSIRCAPGLAAVGIALLRGLEQEHDRARNLRAHRAEDLRHAERHRHVSVVPAGVLDVGHRRLVGHVDELGDRQGVHVGADRHHLARLASLEHADHAGDADLLAHLVEPERAEPIGDQLRGARLAETQFGVPVDVAPRLDEPRPERRRLGRHALAHGRRAR